MQRLFDYEKKVKIYIFFRKALDKLFRWCIIYLALKDEEC